MPRYKSARLYCPPYTSSPPRAVLQASLTFNVSCENVYAIVPNIFYSVCFESKICLRKISVKIRKNFIIQCICKCQIFVKMFWRETKSILTCLSNSRRGKHFPIRYPKSCHKNAWQLKKKKYIHYAAM